MKLTTAQITRQLQENLQLEIGRHLYGILGSYSSLNRFEKSLTPYFRDKEGISSPDIINLNKSFIERLTPEDLDYLVQNEARLPQAIQRRLNDEFNSIIHNLIQESSFIVFKHLELLFAYNLDLHVFRAYATNKVHTLLLLPGEKHGDRVILFHESNPRYHRILPSQLITDNHLWELTNDEH